MKKVCFSFFTFMISFLFVSGQKLSQEEYIARYKGLAILEMKRSGVPASITLAQGLVETESGNSNLLVRSNNHFGIKCKSNWNGPSVSHDDDERDECFRAYQSAEESYRDHSDFLRNSPRYSFLFDLASTDYKSWAEGLRKAGYATNPRYPEILIRYIEAYDLQQYDTRAIIDASTKVANVKIEPPVEVIPVTIQKKISEKNYLPFSTHEINNSKTLFVPGGTSLLAIATKYDIKLTRLLEFNDLKRDGILSTDQFIFLERKKLQGATDYYINTGNETIYEVAQINGVQLQSLIEYNYFSGNERLTAETKVYLNEKNNKEKPILPGTKNTTKSTTTQANKQNEIIIHNVQPREGLYSISKQYGVSVEELKVWNDLPDDKVQIGQRINILR